MFCPKCGTGNEESARFCEKCGAPLIDNSAAPQMTAPQPQMTAPQPQAVPQQPQMTAPQPQAAPSQPQMTAPQPQGMPPQPATPRKPMSPAVIKIIIAAAAAVVLIIAFIVTGSVLSNPKRVVEKYFVAASKGNWEKVYSYIDIPKGEFITKDLMAKAYADETTYDITNFEIEENEYNDSKISKEYYVTYYRTGSSRRTTSVDLVRAGKFMLFWDNYKVSSSDVVAKDVVFTVKQGSKLIIDDIEVSDSYIVPAEDLNASTVQYKIDYLFSGKHQVRVTNDMYEDVERDYTVRSDGQKYQIQSTELRESIKMEREKAAQDDMQALFAAAIANKGFDDVKNLFVEDASRVSSIKSAYNTFVSRTYNSGNGVTKIDFKGFTTSSTTGTTSGMPYVRVTVNAEVEATVNVKSGGSTNVKQVKDSLRDTFTYVYKDGQWKINTVSLDRVSYY